RFVKSKPLTAGTTLKARGFDVDSESVVTLDYTVKGRENVDLLGKITPSIHVETTVTQSGSSIQTSEWLNDELETLKSASNVMGMHIETIACEREYALQQNSPAEIFTASFIKSPRPLNKRMLSNGVAYLISPTEEKKLIFPKSKEQKVDSVENSSDISIQVKPLAMPSGAKMPYDGSDAEILRFLNSNAWIQSENKAIVALANQAVGSETAPDKAASKIEKFVSSYISNRSLSVGYASALEVLHSKQGDCTEFALLTAALCRAVGIPARVVFGVVYVASEFEGHRHFFGGHAWTQVYIADGWYSLDAAMGKFDAGHIAIDTNDGEPSNFFRLISTMGYFDISRVSALK
ncbi:MAG: transglutaminase domain-containing protein, partial [Deltaproteobacteria bacterium]|nr:transglutaminase domain-containing protein [Deltaproteobacteria bacterium]